ncbi:arsenate reductase ArsC [Arthrobacter mobilis]|uniref:Arsenate reductase ArsC n=1 Tax=Arthrobacter mobilis TaxID=2724944 RepID=A0A7X6HEG7_9MICC|nr:arsenate reductase ArsC [Arthrobacter mobilis]NKX55662.1 arsenate reductase ArsC [Arthrobacter mobilis]
MTDTDAAKPSVLFVCERNAGRSQMAAGYLAQLARGTVEVRSAGLRPARRANPDVVAAMAEDGVDISAEQPKALTKEDLERAHLVVTLGSREECPVVPGRRYEDWDLEDTAGKDLAALRPVRDEIKGRVQQLLTELLPARHPDAS